MKILSSMHGICINSTGGPRYVPLLCQVVCDEYYLRIIKMEAECEPLWGFEVDKYRHYKISDGNLARDMRDDRNIGSLQFPIVYVAIY